MSHARVKYLFLTGDGWDLVFEWETDPGADLELSTIVDQTQAGDGEIELEPLEPGTYRVDATHSGLPLTVADDGDVQQDEWVDGDHQHWHVEADGEYYRIEVGDSGRVLEFADGELADGTNVRVGEDTGADHQRWEAEPIFTASGDYYYVLRPIDADQAVDIEGASREPGATALLWDYGGVSNQQFDFEAL